VVIAGSGGGSRGGGALCWMMPRYQRRR